MPISLFCACRLSAILARGSYKTFSSGFSVFPGLPGTQRENARGMPRGLPPDRFPKCAELFKSSFPPWV